MPLHGELLRDDRSWDQEPSRTAKRNCKRTRDKRMSTQCDWRCYSHSVSFSVTRISCLFFVFFSKDENLKLRQIHPSTQKHEDYFLLTKPAWECRETFLFLLNTEQNTHTHTCMCTLSSNLRKKSSLQNKMFLSTQKKKHKISKLMFAQLHITIDGHDCQSDVHLQIATFSNC